MGNAEFPTAGTGVDALFAGAFAMVTHTGFFFVPAPAEYVGAQFFTAETVEDRCLWSQRHPQETGRCLR